MVRMNRHFNLESVAPEGARRYISDIVDAKSLGEVTTRWVTITRTGKFTDPRYGEFEITREMLLSMVKNFDGNVYGQKIVLDVSHNASNGAAGFFRQLAVDGNKLRGQVEFTEYGLDAVKKKGFIYLSAEFMENFIDNEKRKEHGPTLLGAALTTRPVIKRLDPVQLSEDALDGAPPTYLDSRISTLLTEEGTRTMEELLKKLRAALGKFNLAEAIVTQLLSSYKAVASSLADDDIRQTLLAEFVNQGEAIAKQLADSGSAEGGVTLNFDTTGIEKLLSDNQQNGVTLDDVKKMLSEQEAENKKRLAEEKDKLDKNLKLFTDTITSADSLKSLSSDQISRLLEARDVISASLTEEQVKALAENQIKLGNDLVVSAGLAGMGYTPGGVVHQGEANEILSLQEEINKHLRGTTGFNQGNLKLSEDKKLTPFVSMVLAEFDRLNAPGLMLEKKLLAGGEVGIGDSNLPLGVQRTVIREALSDLNILSLVQTLVDSQAQTTTEIPYETRDISDIRDDGVVYEGNPIHRGGITQQMDTAYILAMKLAMQVSNEVMHFTRASAINWDAWARNIESNARVMREMIVRRICNEMQRSADAYGSVAVSAEAFDAQLTGSNSIIKTDLFPIVRPFQERNLKGDAVGSVQNPISVTLNGVVLSAYDGTGNQAAGTYYRVTNYNLGYIQLVDQSGAAVTPTDTGVNTVSYSRATNVALFDLDNGSNDLEVHLNGLLRTIGGRKAYLDQDQFITPNFQIMSATLNNTCTNARAFEAQAKRNGSDTNNDGDLEMVKGIPAFKTNAPSVDLGDERIIMGIRGTLSYTIAKPFMTGQPFEAVDATTGKPIGKKQAYGEEYSAIKVPTPIRNRLTSVIAYSASSR